MLKQIYVRWALAGLLAVGLTSCLHFGGHKSRHTAAPEAESTGPLTAKDYEGRLRALVTAQIEAADKHSGDQKGELLKRKPYYYKEYSVYLEGADALKVVIQERESHSAPYIADVTVAKQRFATRLHREKKEAAKDSNFLRDTGAETLTLELRNGKWARVGSLFVAAKSEENVNGEWLPVRETMKRTVAAEEEKSKGWLRRTWEKLTGRQGTEKKAPEKKTPPKRPPDRPGVTPNPGRYAPSGLR